MQRAITKQATFWQEVNEIAPVFLVPAGACVADEFVSITQQLGALSFGTATEKAADVKEGKEPVLCSR
jgi:hypothetical protein